MRKEWEIFLSDLDFSLPFRFHSFIFDEKKWEKSDPAYKGSENCHFGLNELNFNDGKAEGRGNFLNKGQPLRFFSSSFLSHLTVFSSVNTPSLPELSREWGPQSIPPHPRCRGGWGQWIHALIPYSSYSFNTHSVSRITIECVRQSNPHNPLCRGGWGEWIVTLIPHSSYSLNESEMTMELLNEKKMRDIFEWTRFFTPIPVSFLHFWWEKMRKIRSRLQGIRKLSLWTEWTQF